jgi:hypothetical protein
MASKKFQRKIREVADQVMEEGEEFRSGLAGQAGEGGAAKVGAQSGGAQVMRAGATLAGRMWGALVILGDRNVYLIRTPMLKAYEVKEVVFKAPRDSVEIRSDGATRIRLGDYLVNYTLKMRGQAEQFLAQASAG